MVPGEAEKTERLNTSPYAFGAIPENELTAHQGPFEDQVCGEMGEERKIGG